MVNFLQFFFSIFFMFALQYFMLNFSIALAIYLALKILEIRSTTVMVLAVRLC